MATQNNNLRIIAPKLMYNISVLFQNGEITAEEKNKICQEIKSALACNDCSKLHSQFAALRYGTMFPEIVDECIQLAAIN